MKMKTYKSGAYVFMDAPSTPSGMITVKCYTPDGELIDKIRCETRRQAGEYFRAFCAIARNL